MSPFRFTENPKNVLEDAPLAVQGYGGMQDMHPYLLPVLHHGFIFILLGIQSTALHLFLHLGAFLIENS